MAVLGELGVRLTRFTGAIAAQFSRLDEQSGTDLHRPAAPTSASGTLPSPAR